MILTQKQKEILKDLPLDDPLLVTFINQNFIKILNERSSSHDFSLKVNKMTREMILPGGMIKGSKRWNLICYLTEENKNAKWRIFLDQLRSEYQVPILVFRANLVVTERKNIGMFRKIFSKFSLRNWLNFNSS